MKLYKRVIVGILFLIMLSVLAFLIKLSVGNFNKTQMWLLVTYWKEYLVCIIVEALCYAGIRIVINN